MGWILGSEESERSGTAMVPSGRCHAVDPDEGTTACGRPVRSLHLWAELPWVRAAMLGVARCESCVRATGETR